jgi:glyceraldehyde-3-phosphate dehydrogenase/erythrose-4-phosphate dehydrogenase
MALRVPVSNGSITSEMVLTLKKNVSKEDINKP